MSIFSELVQYLPMYALKKGKWKFMDITLPLSEKEKCFELVLNLGQRSEVMGQRLPWGWVCDLDLLRSGLSSAGREPSWKTKFGLCSHTGQRWNWSQELVLWLLSSGDDLCDFAQYTYFLEPWFPELLWKRGEGVGAGIVSIRQEWWEIWPSGLTSPDLSQEMLS